MNAKLMNQDQVETMLNHKAPEAMGEAMLDQHTFRQGMANLGAAVNVITTDGGAGQAGFTASAVCSVTDTPPSLLVCMNQSSRSHAHFIENQVLSVNVLGMQHEHISSAFASSQLDAQERFKLGQWKSFETGCPILEDAVVSFECQIENIQQVGTHSIFICSVLATHQSQQKGSLVYFNRSYHQISSFAS